jgi:CheY-like chemotaxis protein
MTKVLPRLELIRRGRIAVLDDESPEMLKDLRDQGLSVDHLHSTEDANFTRLQSAFYDLLLLDYGGIGGRFGKDEGLDVLRFLKRVNPALRILAFTARTFDASKADFFRLCDGVVKKDAGTRETLETLEFHLGHVLTPSYQFDALGRTLNLSQSDRQRVERALAKAVESGGDGTKAYAIVRPLAKGGTEALAEALIKKLLELAILGAGALS